MATLAGRGVGVALSFATGVLVARMWGVDGKGLVSLLATVTNLAVRLGTIGFDASVAQFLLVRRVEARACLGTVFSLAAIAGAIGALVAHAGLLSMAGSLDATNLGAARWQATILPAALVLSIAMYAFFALGRAVEFAVFDVAYRFSTLAAAAAAALIGAGIGAVVAFQATALAAASAVGVGLVWRWSGGGWCWSGSVASAMAAYGLRAYVYSLSRYTLAYGGLLVAGVMLGTAEAGLFSVALMLGEAVALTAGSVNLSFGRTVALADVPWQHTRHVAWRMGLFMAGLALLSAAVAPMLIRWVFGPTFMESAVLFAWLAPGLVALAVEQLIGSYFTREGMSWTVAAVMASASLVSMALAVALAPAGLTALALATSASQVATLLLLVALFRRAGTARPAV
jgi:O-antigen/teichoic acid export membrane protein